MGDTLGDKLLANQETFHGALEHRYSQDPIAGKVFYLLLQIAHLLAQLIEYGSLFRQAFPNGVTALDCAIEHRNGCFRSWS